MIVLAVHSARSAVPAARSQYYQPPQRRSHPTCPQYEVSRIFPLPRQHARSRILWMHGRAARAPHRPNGNLGRSPGRGLSPAYIARILRGWLNDCAPGVIPFGASNQAVFSTIRKLA